VPVSDRLVQVVTVSEEDGHRIKGNTAALQDSTTYINNFELGRWWC